MTSQVCWACNGAQTDCLLASAPMIRNGYKFLWNSFYEPTNVDAERVDLMRRSGCEGVFLGTESGSERITKTMNKTARTEHYRWVIPQLKDAGILTHCCFILGFPGETRETVQETVALVEDTQPDPFRTQVWYCGPPTPIWNRRNEFGLKGKASSGNTTRWTRPPPWRSSMSCS